MSKIYEYCPICKKYVNEIFFEKHHVTPVSLIGNNNNIIFCCSTCHDMIHYFIPINEIENYKTYYSITKHPDIQKYLNWVSNRNNPGNWKVKKILKEIEYVS